MEKGCNSLNAELGCAQRDAALERLVGAAHWKALAEFPKLMSLSAPLAESYDGKLYSTSWIPVHSARLILY